MELQQTDISKIEVREIEWQGPFSWTGYENHNNLDTIPETEGIYLWTFEYKDGYLVYCAGITKSTKKRFRQHTLGYKSGNYTVFNINEAEQGRRVEIWHGWSYARTHREEFNERKDEILSAVEEQLKSFRVFVAQIPEKRERARFEAAIMNSIYGSTEPWAELADRGMALSKRRKDEMPIFIKNINGIKFYGLPKTLEI
ncbi:hypothetical protein P1X15_24105 [Runella sp. MFBS21]|uniref:hypothetical protein n=1 Tax=Runella sp. MFBS21 TaxID=3034018 RepID=UPI0023F6289C|nr:hypothetical protein [Runella sp. MFBS21]MDF7820727.1 hypothetical protein [Runella sp. MFBS21]